MNPLIRETLYHRSLRAKVSWKVALHQLPSNFLRALSFSITRSEVSLAISALHYAKSLIPLPYRQVVYLKVCHWLNLPNSCNSVFYRRKHSWKERR